MHFGPSSRIADVLANPEARGTVAEFIPGFADHPAVTMLGGKSIGFIVTRFVSQQGDDAAARLWEALGKIEEVERNRGKDVVCDPRDTYEGADVPEASATVTLPVAATCRAAVELAFAGPSHGNPFTDVEFTARFAREGAEAAAVDAGGFYDGDGRWIVRFLPEVPGRWRFATASNARSLDGITGSVDVAEAAEGDHGPVRADGFHFAHADGTRHLPLGTTAYAWIHQPAEVRAATLRTLEDAPFTKMRMCVFPKAYLHNTNEPELYPFPGNPEDGFDFARFDPAFFRHLEDSVAALGRRGIQADVILFHPYDRWGFGAMGARADDHYTRYVVRRLAAFPNVWWSMANEYDLVDAKSVADWERLAQIVVANDPARHLLSIHNAMTPYDHARDWITHVSLQGTDPYKTTETIDAGRRTWGKPVVVDECGYEGNLEHGWGNLSGREMVRRFWEGAVRGGYAGHGETYFRDDEQIWWAKGNELIGESPARIAFLRRVVEEAPGGVLDPIGESFDFPRAGVPGEYELWYFGCHQPLFRTLTLPTDRHYRVDVIDTWGMTVDTLPGTFSGISRIPLPGREFMALRVVALDAA